ETKDVWHVYARGTPFEVEALRGVSLTVEPGEVFGIVGGTGSGKSTLVQHMNLILTPTSGEVLVDGVNAATIKKSELRRRVGLVFQFPESALFAATVEEDVAFAPRRLGLDEGEVRERVLASLRALGVEDLAGRSPFALSGGEKRRVAIAGVLAMGPEVLVLDEPTAGLDPATREELLALILGLREAGVSVVLVSHDLDEVSEVADRVCALQEGRVRAVGTPAQVFYEDPTQAPAAVQVASLLNESRPEIGYPVRFEDTLCALRSLPGV
ncbi:MAG TPA: ATP-binding cassette domain-containing protein, partial [Rubrobacter sp.]|nr:ATP-binding cassette domain-containing protein [Rubrobacter sp.]